MGMLTVSGLIVLVASAAASADTPTTSDWVVVKIDRVNVAPKNVDGESWDSAKAEEPSGCPLLALGAAAAFGPAGGPIATFLCMKSTSKQRERDPRAPDLFVELRVGERKFRTPVASNTFSEAFEFPIVIPLDAIPAAGMDLRVQDLDKDVNAGQLIGMARLSKQRIKDALAGNPVISLSDDRLERLELVVAPYDPPKEQGPLQFAANQQPIDSKSTARAGELVTISAYGTYGVRSNSEQVDANGYSKKSSYNHPDFKEVNHAAAIAYVGMPTEMHASLLVKTCVNAITPVPGVIYVGVNDTDVSNNKGSIEFTAKVSLPSIDEWRNGVARECQTGGVVPAATDGTITFSDASSREGSTLTVDIVVSKIRSAYYAGVSRCFKQYRTIEPHAEGKVILSLTVNQTGRTVNATAKGFARQIDECIAGQMGSWRFSVPKDATTGDPIETTFQMALNLSL